MIDSTSSGPRRARWVAAAFAMLAAVLIGLIQPAGDASAQATFGGGNLTIVSLATTANPASRDVGLLWNIGNAPGGYSINRVTTNASGNATLAVPNPPGVLGSQNFFIDTVPASAGSAACYRVIPLATGGAAAGSSDMMCIIFGAAQGTVPVNARAELDQSANLKVSWDPTPGSVSFIVWGVGTDGVQGSTGAPVTLPGNGGLICGVVLSLNAAGAINGASNILCGFPGFSSNVSSGTASTPTSLPVTATRTNTPGSPTSTSTNTAGPTSTSTATAVPSATVTQTATSTTTQTPTITLTPAPVDLLIVKSAQPNPANAGGTVTFSLQINNIGGTLASGITVQDNLPAGLTFIAAGDASNPNRGFVCGASGSVVACNSGTLAPGQSATIEITALIDNPCVVTSPIANTATVNPNNTIPESSTANNSSTFSLTVIGCAQATSTLTRTATRTATSTATASVITLTPTLTATPAVDLTIGKLGSPNPIDNNNGILTYLIPVGNAGPSAVSNVTVLDSLPVNTTYLSSSGDSGFICSPNGPPVTIVTCSGGQIGGNGGAVIQIVVSVGPGCATGSALVNSVTVDPGNSIPESNENNNTATFTSTCGLGANTVTPLPATAIPNTATRTQTATATAIPPAALTFLKVGNPPIVNPGGTITWTVTLQNNTGSTVSGINVTDDVPGTNGLNGGVPMPIVSFVGDSGFTCIDQSPAEPEIVCTGGSIASGATGTITITQFVGSTANCTNIPGGIFTNTAKITAPAVTQNTAVGTSTLAQTSPGTCTTPSPTGTGTSTATAGPSGTPTATGTVTSSPTLTLTATATPFADLDTSGAEGNDNLVTNTVIPGNYTSERVLRLANDGNTLIGGITFTETIAGTAAKATRNVVLAGSLGGGCTFTGLPTDPTYDLNCNLALGPDNGTLGDNVTTGTPDADTALITITIGGTGTAGQTITYSAVTPVCTIPGACTSGVASPANSDGGVTIIPADTDTLQADLDTTFCTNAAETTCVGNAPTFVVAQTPEDLSVAGGWASQALYDFRNFGPGPIEFPPCPPAPCGVTVNGSINTSSNAVYSGGVLAPGVSMQVSVFQNNPSGPGRAPWFCSTNLVAVPITWTCTGDLGSGAPNQLDNQAIVVVQVTGTSGATGQTIIYDTVAPICQGSPGPCTDGAVSPANADGSDLTPGVAPNSWLTHTDTLTP